MKVTNNYKALSFILAATLSMGLSFAAPTFADSWIVGSNGAGLVELGSLGGGETVAYDINDRGQAVGFSPTAGGENHAFITGPDGAGITDLGTLGGTYSIAWGINNAGQVVGSSTTRGGQTHAFITGPNGVGWHDRSWHLGRTKWYCL
jgi:probable HAF family extracellular repeat protein